MDKRKYHLAELDIALSPSDPRRILPDIPRTCHRILDVGCGAGQSLIALNLPPSVAAVGIDSDADAIRLGHELHPSLRLVWGAAEALPFQNQSLDFVFSRVALPYMNIPLALREMARVLVPSGGIWLTLHPLTMTFEQLRDALCGFNPKSTLFQIYVLLNGLYFYITAKTFYWPSCDRRYESFQTSRGMRRALQVAGFVDVEIRKGRHYVITARKRSK